MEVIKPVMATCGTAGLWEGKVPDPPPQPKLGHGASGNMWEGDQVRQLCMGALGMEQPRVPVGFCSHLVLCGGDTPSGGAVPGGTSSSSLWTSRVWPVLDSGQREASLRMNHKIQIV